MNLFHRTQKEMDIQTDFYCTINGSSKKKKKKSVISQTKSLFTNSETLGLKLHSYCCIFKAGVK